MTKYSYSHFTFCCCQDPKICHQKLQLARRRSEIFIFLKKNQVFFLKKTGNLQLKFWYSQFTFFVYRIQKFATKKIPPLLGKWRSETFFHSNKLEFFSLEKGNFLATYYIFSLLFFCCQDLKILVWAVLRELGGKIPTGYQPRHTHIYSDNRVLVIRRNHQLQ